MTKIVACGLFAAMCGVAQKIDVQFDQSVDFTKFKTFAIRNGQIHSKQPSLNNELVKKHIESQIEQNLTRKGLTEVSGPSDLNVRYSLGSAGKREIETYPTGWRGYGVGRIAVHYTEGTLVIDLRDPSTRSLVWRGIAVEEKTDPMKIEGRIDAMVKKAIDKYPPKMSLR
jgi:hypothetical protein